MGEHFNLEHVKPLLGEKYVEGKRKINAKFSGHYVRPLNVQRTHYVRSNLG